jgi:hypothetical protein
LRQSQADSERGELIVRNRAESETNSSVTKKGRKKYDHGGRDGGCYQIEFADQNAGYFKGSIVDSQIQAVDLCSPKQLSRALDNVGKTQRCHEQRNGRLINKWAQDDSFDRDPKNDHDS